MKSSYLDFLIYVTKGVSILAYVYKLIPASVEWSSNVGCCCVLFCGTTLYQRITVSYMIFIYSDSTANLLMK